MEFFHPCPSTCIVHHVGIKTMIPLTQRTDINVGYSCNERCKFCYYIQTVKDQRKEKDLTTQEVQNQLLWIRKKGIQHIDFTGGEPTIRPDLLKLVQFATSLGFQTRCMITNGIRTADSNFAKACVEAGINDVLVSIHGNNAQTHDQVTEAPGSFEKTLQTVKNFSSLPTRVRANCVISGINFQQAPETLSLFHELQIQTANFILFNPIVEADWRSAPELNVRYSEAAPFLQKAISLFQNKIKKITVRYIPFCLMRGYEPFVTNMPQIQYDPDEWDYVIRTEIREGKVIAKLALWAGMVFYPQKSRLFSKGWNAFQHEGIKYFLQKKNKSYGPQCSSCSYRKICDGLWKQYARWQGFSELQSISGPPLSDPTHFLKSNPNYS